MTLGVGWPGRGWVAKPARGASSDIHWLNDACWLRLRSLSSMNGLVRQSLPTEQRKVAGSIPAPVILIKAGQLTRLRS